MKTDFQGIVVPVLPSCTLTVVMCLAALGTAFAQPVPTTFTRIATGSIATEQLHFLYHNDGNTNQWLKIKCVGGPSNRAAIGAKIRVQIQNGLGASVWQMREISGGSSYGSQNSLITHFGLCIATNALTVRIEWPSGIVQTLTNVAAKQLLTATEPPLLKADLVDGGVRLLLTDNIGCSTDIEASIDLTEWDAIGTVTHTTRTMPFVDPAADNQLHRFYRAVRQ